MRRLQLRSQRNPLIQHQTSAGMTSSSGRLSGAASAAV